MQKLLPLLLLLCQLAGAQAPPAAHPYSTQAEIGFPPCLDTFSIFKFRQSYDLGLMLPSWYPIVDKNYIAILEGTVNYNPQNGSHGPHVSHEDLPFYHYSHDVDFDVLPDKTSDGRFEYLLPYLVHKRPDGNDTTLDNTVHVEWECGLGMSNRINPLRNDNNTGRSGGFFSAGHEREDVIWNWPAAGDWVHVEGHYVWDRGHPPAHAEIHPPRIVATKRALPQQIVIGDSSVKYATRVDIFASGDGGALMNNRFNAPAFVKRVNMSSKDYVFTVHTNQPRPSPHAVLRYMVVKQKPDNFSQGEIVETLSDSGYVTITIPWKSKNANDLEIYARTMYLFWDEGKGLADELPVDVYKVTLNHLRFKNLNDKLSKAEVRLFVNVGSEWIFLNDFFPKKGKILTKGLGKTYDHHWDLKNEFTVFVPRGEQFRVYVAGWEVDGVDRLAGALLDPSSPCDRKTRRFVKDKIFSIRNMLMKGCMDDVYGEISRLHSHDNLGRQDRFINAPKEGKNDDPCPFSKYSLADRYFLTYTIEKVN